MAVLERLAPTGQPAPNEPPRNGIVESTISLAHHFRTRLIKEQRLDPRLPARKLRPRIEALVAEMMREEARIISPSAQLEIIQIIIHEITGFGPLEPLLRDDSISEIMVNWVGSTIENPEGYSRIYIERNGMVVAAPLEIRFTNRAHLMHIIDRIVSPLGRRVDEANPMVDARLPDGSRVNAVIPPLAVDGPTLTIRRFRKRALGIDDLVEKTRTMSLQMTKMLELAVRAKLNILVSGGTGSGKTTTLNILANFIPRNERIVTIEDAAELRFHEGHPHVVRLEARPANIEGEGQVSIRDLVYNALRMRPDRIVVGEVRGAEALDMLQAMNTGHEGSMTTVHANNTRDAFKRLETMVMWAEGAKELPLAAIREQLVGALDLVLQQDRLPSGERKITSISEVQGIRHGNLVLKDLFLFQQTGIDADGRAIGYFTATGVKPHFMSRLRAVLPDDEAAHLEKLFDIDYFVPELGAEIMHDDSISEIMINSPHQVYIERAGRLETLPPERVRIKDNTHLRHIIATIAARMGRLVGDQNPMVDARLPDGSRVNALLPPVSGDYPTITIRRFRQTAITLDEMIAHASIDRRMAYFLQAAVASKMNILVSGGTGSGKTTTLNILSQAIPEWERIITMEDVRELKLQKQHLLSQETRPSDEFNEGEVTMRDLVRNSLRMRPDRIIVGEVRGGEALDMLQAMNTGHEGSMTTLHANDPEAAFARLETLVRMSPEGADLDTMAVRQQLCAIEIVAQQARLSDGTRKIVAVYEVLGLKEGMVHLEPIFEFTRTALSTDGRWVQGHFAPTGNLPTSFRRLRSYGFAIDEQMFDSNDVTTVEGNTVVSATAWQA